MSSRWEIEYDMSILPDLVEYQKAVTERREKWDRRYLDIAKEVSTWSKDPSTRVGAVVVRDNRIVSVGYNGFPEGVEDTEDRYNDREMKYELIVHAEVNAILTAGGRARGGTLYVYPGFGSPCVCTGCCKAAIQSGIKRIVGLLVPQDKERFKRWESSLKTSQMMCSEVGIETVQYEE